MPCAYHRCHAGHCGGRQAPASTGRQLRTPRRRTAVWWRAWRWCTSQPNPPPPPQPRTRHRKTRPWQRPGRISGIRRLCTCGSGGQGKGDWQWQSRRVVVAQTTMPRAAFTGITWLLAVAQQAHICCARFVLYLCALYLRAIARTSASYLHTRQSTMLGVPQAPPCWRHTSLGASAACSHWATPNARCESQAAKVSMHAATHRRQRGHLRLWVGGVATIRFVEQVLEAFQHLAMT